MSSKQSSSSPTKSRSGTPLQLKSDNVKRLKTTSPLKLTPIKLQAQPQPQFNDENILTVTNNNRSSIYLSPTKSPLRNTVQSPFSTTQLRKTPKFKIFQDDTDYRSQLPKTQPATVSQLLTPEQDNKENVCGSETERNHLKLMKNQLSDHQQRPRIPLVDLDIKSYPGFLQQPSSASASNNNHVLEPRYQLTQLYKPEQIVYKNLPLFVTPPRRKQLDNIRFISKTSTGLTKKNLSVKLRKCNSFDGRVAKPFINAKSIKSNKFAIYNDGKV